MLCGYVCVFFSLFLSVCVFVWLSAPFHPAAMCLVNGSSDWTVTKWYPTKRHETGADVKRRELVASETIPSTLQQQYNCNLDELICARVCWADVQCDQRAKERGALSRSWQLFYYMCFLSERRHPILTDGCVFPDAFGRIFLAMQHRFSSILAY